MAEKNVKQLLDLIGVSKGDAEIFAVRDLKKLGVDIPKLMLTKYKEAASWKVRLSCVYLSVKYARQCEYAFELGVLALRDRSKKVVYRACMLLAYSLRRAALPALERLVLVSTDDTIKEDALAAIDAIQHQNHHYFVDRTHSGKIKLNVPSADCTDDLIGRRRSV